MDRFSSYLPSKTFMSTVASLVIVVFLIAAVYFWPSQRQNVLTIATGGGNIERINQVITDQDTDGDGLKDWEEILWKTDPYQKDTDKDGTSDGDEVKAGRNPLKPGPNDKSTISSLNTTSGDGPLSTTDIIARDLFSRYAEAKQSGGTLDQPTEQQIISAVLSRPDLVTAPKVYGSKDITVTTSDTATLRAYGNAMGAIIKKYSFGNENELVIFQKAVTNDDPEELKKLDPIIKGYEGMIASFLKVGVPQNAMIMHLSFVNSISGVLSSIKSMRTVYEDPANSLINLNGYLRYVNQIADSLKSVSSFFKDKGIVFTQSEDGGYYVTPTY